MPAALSSPAMADELASCATRGGETVRGAMHGRERGVGGLVTPVGHTILQIREQKATRITRYHAKQNAE